MEIENLLTAFDIGFKSCELKKDYYKSKIDFIKIIRKSIKTKESGKNVLL